MKKIFNIIMLFVVAVSGLTLTACSEDNLDTNQYRGGVSLSAYGPQPVMRGGYLRFLGSNLDQIREIKIPNVDPITNIEVVQGGTPSEIRIVVPKDGPKTGYITLTSKTDEKIVTKTQLTFEEPISIESMTEAAMPGDVIEIKGDYLSLIHMVEFAKEVWVSEENFVSHDRYSIKVRVPENARTGIINLYTADLTGVEDPDALNYNIVPTEKALIVGTPTVAGLASPRGTADALGTVTIKQGEELSISGEYFQLVDSVKFGGAGNDSVYVKAITMSQDAKSIKLVLPAEAPDGPVNLVAKSGVEIPVGNITTVAPTGCVAAPSPVKAGQALTITGNDLDVVATITMEGVEDKVEFTYADGKITIKAVPETAVDGDAKLVMKNGKSVAVAYTLVKPAATKYSANPVSAGGALSIEGTNLDLVKTVTFNGSETPVEVTAEADGTVINLTVPMDAKSGAITFTLANGKDVTCPEITIEEAVFCYVTEFPAAEVELKAGETMTVTAKNIDKLTGIKMNGVDCQYIVTGEKIIIGIPETTPAKGKLNLISSNGKIEYDVTIIPATEVTLKLFSGMVFLDWDKGMAKVPAEKFADIPEGAIMTITYNVDASSNAWTQLALIGIDWSHSYSMTAESGYKFDRNYVPSDDPAFDNYWALSSYDNLTAKIVLDAANLAILKEKGLAICGGNGNTTVTKVTVDYTISLEADVAPFTTWAGNNSVNITYPFNLSWTDDKTGKIMISRVGLKDLGVKVGSKLYFYKEGTGQAQINTPNWGQILTAADWVGTTNPIEVEINQTMMDCVNGTITDGWSNAAFVIQGDGLKITKITVLP